MDEQIKLIKVREFNLNDDKLVVSEEEYQKMKKSGIFIEEKWEEKITK